MIPILLHLIIILVVLGILWKITTLFPLPPPYPLAVQLAFGLVAFVVVADTLLMLAGVKTVAYPLWWR